MDGVLTMAPDFFWLNHTTHRIWTYVLQADRVQQRSEPRDNTHTHMHTQRETKNLKCTAVLKIWLNHVLITFTYLLFKWDIDRDNGNDNDNNNNDVDHDDNVMQWHPNEIDMDQILSTKPIYVQSHSFLFPAITTTDRRRYLRSCRRRCRCYFFA